ncbi:penicillin acylase family protein [Streptomyces sp. NPDC006798]|uniref:penicillin acylase family protein n=1 Tax=Streptomyces sp. NPDC006798 TaxID=3155462 RepID=UPI0033C206A8
MGPDPAAWRWGDLPTHTFFDPVSGAALGPIPRGGTHHTPKISRYFPGCFAEAGGATLGMVPDVGSWDASRALDAPGRSGDRRGPHHADPHRRWAAGDPFPLLYGRTAVEAAAADRFLPHPAGADRPPPDHRAPRPGRPASEAWLFTGFIPR